MSSPVVSIDGDRPVQEAARLMVERGVGSLLVERGGERIGIMTERDLTREIVTAGADPSVVTAAQVMSTPVVTIGTSAQIDEALDVMEENGVRHLLVTLEGEVRGMVTVTDLARAHPELNRRLRGALGARWED